MTKWAYLSMQFERDDIKRFRDSLNEFGEIGWPGRRHGVSVTYTR